MMVCQTKRKKKSKQSLLQKLKNRIAFLLLRKEVEVMAVVLATLIIKGSYSFAKVPSTAKDQVKQILIDMDLPELAE